MREIIIGLQDADYWNLKARIKDSDGIDLVRCEKCMSHSNRTGWCSIWMTNTPPSGHCHRGEFKKDGETDG